MSTCFHLVTLFVFLSFVSTIQAQRPDADSATLRLYQAEQSFGQEIRDRINSVRAYDTVWCGLLDRTGSLWFGTNNGAYRFDGTTFTNYSTNDGLCDKQVFTILEDFDGDLWFGTANGLCRYDRTTFHHIPVPWSDISGPWLDKVYPIVNPNQVMCMIQASNGDLWLGTNGAGAYRYDGNTFESYLANKGHEYETGQYNNIIHSILEDASGDIWFTSISHGGLSRFDGTDFTHYSIEDGLSDDMIRSSYQGRDGFIWFGSHGKHTKSGIRDGGLDFYFEGSFTQVKQTPGLLDGHVLSIFEDKNGSIWLGLGTNPMCIYDRSTVRPFVTEDGQSFEGIHFILEDAIGDIWFGGRNGMLLRYNWKTVDDFSRKWN